MNKIVKLKDDRRTDRINRNEAERIERQILAQYPERKLDHATEKKINEYARDRLGSLNFSPWLRTYTVVRRQFIEGWIPDNYFARVIRPTFTPVSEHLGEKSLARQLLGTDLFPDLASLVRGCWRDPDGASITKAEARNRIFADADTAFLKKENSNRGRGVTKISINDFDSMDFLPSDNFVVQSLIRQHPFFDTWNPSGGTTLRLTTYKPTASAAKVCAAALRIPGHNTEVVISGSSYKAPIDASDGRLTGICYNAKWNTADTYGEGGPAIGTPEIPHYQNLCRAVEALHDKVPHVTVVGWDLILDQNEKIQIMEWNTMHPDIKFIEATSGPHFTDLILPN